LHVPGTRSLFVNLEIGRKSLLELQGDALTHETFAIDCVDQGLGIDIN
jgi:hypothetical protein